MDDYCTEHSELLPLRCITNWEAAAGDSIGETKLGINGCLGIPALLPTKRPSNYRIDLSSRPQILIAHTYSTLQTAAHFRGRCIGHNPLPVDRRPPTKQNKPHSHRANRQQTHALGVTKRAAASLILTGSI